MSGDWLGYRAPNHAQVDLIRQIKCVERELAMRERVYPKRMARGKMNQKQVDDELSAMRAVLASLLLLQTSLEELVRQEAAAL